MSESFLLMNIVGSEIVYSGKDYEEMRKIRGSMDACTLYQFHPNHRLDVYVSHWERDPHHRDRPLRPINQRQISLDNASLPEVHKILGRIIEENERAK